MIAHTHTCLVIRSTIFYSFLHRYNVILDFIINGDENIVQVKCKHNLNNMLTNVDIFIITLHFNQRCNQMPIFYSWLSFSLFVFWVFFHLFDIKKKFNILMTEMWRKKKHVRWLIFDSNQFSTCQTLKVTWKADAFII